MKSPHLNQMQQRSNAEADGQINFLKRSNSYSITELINSRLEHKLFVSNERSVEFANQVSEHCRQASRTAPYGTWLPLAALSRDLMTTGSAANLTTGGMGNKLQPALEKESAIFSGATILSGLTGSSFTLPGINSPLDASGAWVGEAELGPQKEPTFKPTTLAPKELIFQILVSRRLMNNSSVDLESELCDEIRRSVFREIDRAALNGAGGDEPSGLLSNPDLQVISAGANGAAPTWAHLVEAEYQVATRVGQMKNPTFLTSPAIRKKLRTTQRAAGLDFVVTSADSVMGQPLKVSPLMPDNLTKGSSSANCSALLYGDLSEVYIGFWGPLAVDILVDGRTRAKDGLIVLTCRASVGVNVRNIQAFTAYKDLLSA